MLVVEQNARSALEMSDFGVVLNWGRTRIVDTAETILNEPRIGELFLGTSIEAVPVPVESEAERSTPTPPRTVTGTSRPPLR